MVKHYDILLSTVHSSKTLLFKRMVIRITCTMSFTVGGNPEKTIDRSHENNKLYQTMCASQVLMEIMGIRTHSLSDDNP